jgi:hypothetical protein
MVGDVPGLSLLSEASYSEALLLDLPTGFTLAERGPLMGELGF